MPGRRAWCTKLTKGHWDTRCRASQRFEPWVERVRLGRGAVADATRCGSSPPGQPERPSLACELCPALEMTSTGHVVALSVVAVAAAAGFSSPELPNWFNALEHALALWFLYSCTLRVASDGLRKTVKRVAGVLLANAKALPGVKGALQAEVRRTAPPRVATRRATRRHGRARAACAVAVRLALTISPGRRSWTRRLQRSRRRCTGPVIRRPWSPSLRVA